MRACGEVFSVHHRRIHACCYCLSAESVEKNLQDYTERLVSVVEAVCTGFPVAISTFFERWFHRSWSCHPWECHSCQWCSRMTNSTTLGFMISLKMMMLVVGVLNFSVAQSTPPSENLAILRIFWLQDPVCCFEGSLMFMEYEVLRVFQHVEDS